MKTIITKRNIIKADAFEEISMHPELPIILFSSGDLFYENVLQIPMTFKNRFFAREAMERIDSGMPSIDLTDIACEWPESAAELITDYLLKTRKERKEYDSISQESAKDTNEKQ